MSVKTPNVETRLFPPDMSTALHHKANLSAIVDMCTQWPEPNMTALHAGYTYWGQFIAHELGPRAEVVPDRSSILDLESLYGKDGWHDEQVKLNAETGEFILGDTLPVSGFSQCKRDLYRDEEGVPVIPDIRNDAHLLIAQFHVLMQRCHNAVVRELNRTCNNSAEANFSLARGVLTLLFHKITLDDYLEKITDEVMYRDIVFEQNHQYFQLSPELPLPLEFVDAGFRFGHCQVKEDYTLNSFIAEVNLEKIFELSSAGSITKQTQLPADHFVEWSKFFHTTQFQIPQGGLRICPNITKSIQDIPLPDDGSHNIIELNLLAGIKSLLPSGQQIATMLLEEFPHLEGLGISPRLKFSSTELGRYAEEKLHQAQILDCTPLWLYILIEAENSKAQGVKLGPLGSLLVCETLKNAITNTTIINKEKCEDFAHRFMSGISNINDLINFVETNEKELLQ